MTDPNFRVPVSVGVTEPSAQYASGYFAPDFRCTIRDSSIASFPLCASKYPGRRPRLRNTREFRPV